MLLALVVWIRICRDGLHEFQLDFQSRLRDVLKSRGSVRAFVGPMIRDDDDDDDNFEDDDDDDDDDEGKLMLILVHAENESYWWQ